MLEPPDFLRIVEKQAPLPGARHNRPRENAQYPSYRKQDVCHRLVLLVGDEPYYSRVGFQKVPAGRLLLPGPVDPDRLLYLELRHGALSEACGLVLSPRRFGS